MRTYTLDLLRSSNNIANDLLLRDVVATSFEHDLVIQVIRTLGVLNLYDGIYTNKDVLW
jgi:hypothetical protein